MPCTINSGYTIECPKDSIGGLKVIRFCLLSDIINIIEDGGEISEIVLKPGASFFVFEFPKNTTSFNCNPSGNVQNSSLMFTERLSLIINKLRLSTTLIIESLSKASLCAIVEDNNGNGYLLGRTEGIDLIDGIIGSGISFGDRNGYELNFVGEEPKISHVSAAFISTFYGATGNTSYILVNAGEFWLTGAGEYLRNQ